MCFCCQWRELLLASWCALELFSLCLVLHKLCLPHVIIPPLFFVVILKTSGCYSHANMNQTMPQPHAGTWRNQLGQISPTWTMRFNVLGFICDVPTRVQQAHLCEISHIKRDVEDKKKCVFKIHKRKTQRGLIFVLQEQEVGISGLGLFFFSRIPSWTKFIRRP